jgi:hypothetical protein
MQTGDGASSFCIFNFSFCMFSSDAGASPAEAPGLLLWQLVAGYGRIAGAFPQESPDASPGT